MTLHDEILRARERLRVAGIDEIEAAVDAELLARTVLGWDRARLITSMHSPAPDGFTENYLELVGRRERREPAAYIVGRREFWNRDFEVGPGVLVPRPETELVVEEALARLAERTAAGGEHRRRERWVADVGTGSGCLAVTLALEAPNARVVATDRSSAALEIASRNARRYAIEDRIDLVETDLLASVDRLFDVIVSNPPYVPDADLPGLAQEVREYEPVEALAAGPQGMDVITRLLRQCESRLRPDGALVFEFGFGQEPLVRQAIAARPAYRLERVRADLQGIPRTATVLLEGGAREVSG